MLRRYLTPPAVAPAAACAGLRHFSFPPSFQVPDVKAVNPLEKLRPPAPPSASDARPFGSLNRSLRPMNYTNINSPRHAGDTAATPARADVASVSTPTATASASGSPSRLEASAEPARLDLSRLLKKHRTAEAAPQKPHAPSTATVTDPDSAGAPVAGAAFFQTPASATAGHDTVIKAQSIIAEREQKLRAASSAKHAHRPTPRRDDAPAGSTALHQQVYKEHCTVGWSPEDFYRVVADVNQYSAFLPWCSDSVVHTTRRVRVPPPPQQLAANEAAMKQLIGEDGLLEAFQMTATLKVGFSFFNEQYTSLVTLVPGSHITAVLHEGDVNDVLDASADKEVAGSRRAAVRTDKSGSNGGGVGLVSSFFRRAAHSANEAAKKSILRNLRCDWEFAAIPGRPNEVEVVFSVSFEFKNPMHSKFIMSNVVSLMTRSFENRTEQLYGPPSASRQRLPALD